ncbi:MAG: helical backbone metal receptor, partial [FCB group bacterium]|nr:helical backbone metal receptor [FCB group bacterium]
MSTGARHGVVSFGPQVTETIFALGEGSRVVAVTDFCDYPPEVAKLPKVGGYMNPDFEKVTMLRPELVIL